MISAPRPTQERWCAASQFSPALPAAVLSVLPWREWLTVDAPRPPATGVQVETVQGERSRSNLPSFYAYAFTSRTLSCSPILREESID